MNGEILVKVSAHTTHGPCQFEAEVQNSMCRLKEAASASQEPPSRLINRELQSSFPGHMRGNFPQEDTARRIVIFYTFSFQPNLTHHTTECSPFHCKT